MYKIDYNKVAKDYNKKFNTMYAGNYLSRIDRGVIPCTNILENIKKICYKSGKPLKKYLIVDYKEVAKKVYEKTNTVYTPSYLKQIHNKSYTSKEILPVIESVLKDHKDG